MTTKYYGCVVLMLQWQQPETCNVNFKRQLHYWITTSVNNAYVLVNNIDKYHAHSLCVSLLSNIFAVCAGDMHYRKVVLQEAIHTGQGGII